MPACSSRVRRRRSGGSAALGLLDDIVEANGGATPSGGSSIADLVSRRRVDRWRAGRDRVDQPAGDGATDALRRCNGVRLAIGTAGRGAAQPDGDAGAAARRSRSTIAEAMTAHTRGSAFAEFQDGEKGTIARGDSPTW